MKKKGFIIFIIILAICLGGFGGFLVYKHMNESESFDQEWANTYYEFIKEEVPSDSQIGFIEADDFDDPVMVIEYNAEEKSNIDMYYIDENEEISDKVAIENASVLLLYNVDADEYDWYIYQDGEESDIYSNVSDLLKFSDESKYTYEKEEMISIETLDGETISIAKVDTELIETGIVLGTIDYSDDLDSESLKESIDDLASEYQVVDKIITNDVSVSIEEKIEEVNKILEEIEKAEAEVEAQKAAEEEAAKSAAEEAAKGLKVGSYTLKYGTYKGVNFSTGEILTINSDGTATLKMGSTVYNYTYTVGKDNFAQDSSSTSYHYAIIFSGSNSFSLFPDSNDHLTSGDTYEYVYSED